ncbi:MAG: YheU family protein [Legionella sp.]|nr:YheU family protein [Legionella sp.]
MLKIDHTLLSKEALENLIIEVITRETSDYGEYEIEIQTKKNQLLQQIIAGNALIAYSDKEEVCDIISLDEYKAFQKVHHE